MYTIIKIASYVILFVLLFLFEFFHIKTMVKQKGNENKNETKESDTLEFTLLQYKKFAAVSYSIVNIFVILFFIFAFPENTFFGITKLLWLTGIILFFMCFCFSYSKTYKNFSSFKFLTFILLVFVAFLVFVNICSYVHTLNFEKVLDTKFSNSKITTVTNIGKFDNYYLVSYIKNNTPMQKVINENEVKSIVYEDKIAIYEETLIYLNVNIEERNAKEYETTKNEYTIYCPKGYITNLK